MVEPLKVVIHISHHRGNLEWLSFRRPAL